MTRKIYEARVVRVPTNDVHPNDFNFTALIPEDFEQLCEQTQHEGINRLPILCRPKPAGQLGYEVIDGEQRRRAAERVGLPEVEIAIFDVDRLEAMFMYLNANKRGRNNRLKEGRMLLELKGLSGLTNKKLAERAGLHVCEGTIRGRFRLVAYANAHPHLSEEEVLKAPPEDISTWWRASGVKKNSRKSINKNILDVSRVELRPGGDRYNVTLTGDLRRLEEAHPILFQYIETVSFDMILHDAGQSLKDAQSIVRLLEPTVEKRGQRLCAVGAAAARVVLNWADKAGWEIQCMADVKTELLYPTLRPDSIRTGFNNSLPKKNFTLDDYFREQHEKGNATASS